MVNLNDFKNKFDFSKTESQALVVHSVRFAFLLLVLLFTLSFQFLESRIDAFEVFKPLYILIVISFSIQFVFFAFFKKLYGNQIALSGLFIFEAFYITGLIYYIGIQQSILIFLYLVNLILCGILFQRKGALLLALWTSVLFSFIVSMDTSLSGNTAYLAVGANNLAFFTVAYLAGYLSEQLNIMGIQLEEKVRDVKILRNLNELILSNIKSGLITVDKSQTILQANPAAHSQLGLAADSMLGNKLNEFLPGLEVSAKNLDRDFDFIFNKNSEKRLFKARINKLLDDVKSDHGSIVVFDDETHLRALEKRLRQSEKMAAIGQLAAGIAHEIRNPLAGISGSVQLMQLGDSDAEQTAKLMGIVTKEIDRLNNLITEFLDFAKPEAPMEDHLDIGALVEEIAEFTKNDSGASAQVAKQISPGLIILGNRDKLKQAFLNILVNAFQALDKSESPKVSIDVKKSGDMAIVSIRDNGVGMPADLIDRIFEPFHTTKHKGTGLGLAITHSIIEAHNAQVLVESEPGGGTEFRLQFKLLSSSPP